MGPLCNLYHTYSPHYHWFSVFIILLKGKRVADLAAVSQSAIHPGINNKPGDPLHTPISNMPSVTRRIQLEVRCCSWKQQQTQPPAFLKEVPQCLPPLFILLLPVSSSSRLSLGSLGRLHPFLQSYRGCLQCNIARSLIGNIQVIGSATLLERSHAL